MHPAEHVRWLRQWQAAGSALAADKRTWLGALDDASGLRFAEAVLALAGATPVSAARWNGSGLVAQQEIFRRQPL